MNLNSKQQAGTLFIFWLIVQSALFYRYGIDTSLESQKYIGAASHLLERGYLPETRYFFYLGTTLIIAFCLKTGLGFSGVVVIQLLLNLFATLSFYKALQKNQKRNYSAFFTVLLLISFLPFQTWNFFLYTESVFYSFALLFFSACLTYPQITKTSLVIQAMFLLLTIVSRPLGIVFLPCWVLFLAFKKKIKPVVIFWSLVTALVIAFFVINTIMSSISDWQILKPAEFGYIICDIPSRNKLELDYLKQYSPLTQLFLFVIQHPLEFFRLCAKRLAAFFFLSRSYYSSLHNLYLLIYAIVFTIPFLYTVFLHRKKITNKPVFHLAILVALAFTITIALQCDDYNNRFHHTIVPVFLFGGIFLLLENSRMENIKRE